MAESRPSAWQLERVMSRVQETLAQLRDGEGLVLDTAENVLKALHEEGVDARKILQRVGVAKLEAKAMGAAQDQRIADLKARRERSAREEAMWRATAGAIAETIIPADAEGKRKYKDPEFTLSVAPGEPQPLIPDVDDLDPEYVVEEVVRKPNKALIHERLKAGVKVRNAYLSNAPPRITIRSK